MSSIKYQQAFDNIEFDCNLSRYEPRAAWFASADTMSIVEISGCCLAFHKDDK